VGFTKLDADIVKSTIWFEESDVLRIWIYLLASADNQGLIFTTVPAMAAHNLMSVDRVREILEKFSNPDPDSRSQEHEGRRIEITRDPEYVIRLLNYELYRSRDHGHAVRQKNYRERQTSGMAQLLKAQDYRCGCCRDAFEEPYSLYVVQDHDHASGTNRALLCQSCNKVVGMLENGQEPILSPKVDLCRVYLVTWGDVSVTSRDVSGTQDRRQKTEVRSQKTEKQRTKDSSAARGAAEIVYPPEFLAFWEAYPRKVDRGDAFKAWQKIQRPRPDIQAITTSITALKASRQWQEKNGRFIPHPSTWLNRRGWESQVSDSDMPHAESGLALPPLTGV